MCIVNWLYELLYELKLCGNADIRPDKLVQLHVIIQMNTAPEPDIIMRSDSSEQR